MALGRRAASLRTLGVISRRDDLATAVHHTHAYKPMAPPAAPLLAGLLYIARVNEPTIGTLVKADSRNERLWNIRAADGLAPFLGLLGDRHPAHVGEPRLYLGIG